MPNWLNMGGLADDRFGKPTDDEVRCAEFTGVLRGVQSISFGKLARALTMQVVRLDGATPEEPNFLVLPTDLDDADEGGRVRRRGTQWADYYPEDAEGEYVSLFDRQIEPRCHCSDQIWRGETAKTPCAHILAALVDIQHPHIMALVAELRERNAIAAAANVPSSSTVRSS